MKDLPPVSIIVPCRNEKRYIRNFIASLMNQDYPKEKMEVVIAEGMSEDSTRDTLKELVSGIEWIKVIDNPGKIVSTGLNLAIRKARHEIVLRMDVHTEYAYDYVSRCVKTLLETGYGNVGGPARTKSRGYIQGAIAAAFNSFFAVGNSPSHFEYEGEVDTVSFGCWYKKTLFKIGLWDESFKKNQDDELNFRLKKAGYKIWQNPAIRSWYYPRDSLIGLFIQYFKFGYWKVFVIKKHKRPASLQHLIPALFLLSLFLSIILARFTDYGIMGFYLISFIYGLFIGVGALVTAFQSSLRFLPVLPIVFATFHIGYGLGFLCGIISVLLSTVKNCLVK